MDLRRYGAGADFLAVGKMGTRLRRTPLARLQELADGQDGDPIADLLDGWIAGLSRRLTAEVVPGPLAAT